MLIGGTIRLIEGTGISVSGGAARIVSLADIHLNFVDGRSSGYVVNGVEGAISSGATGFFSGQNAQQIFTPAILGSTLLVSYSDDSIRDVLRATLREHREDSDNENLMREDDEDEDKKRPVCRGT